MGATTIITGNLGQNPELKYRDVNTPTGTEKKAVCEFSVFQSHERLNKSTGEYEDKGGFWVEVSIWGKEAEQLIKTLRKGFPVKVEGDMHVWNWTDADQVARQSIKIEARRNGVSLLLYGVEAITMRQNQKTNDAPPSSQGSQDYNQPPAQNDPTAQP